MDNIWHTLHHVAVEVSVLDIVISNKSGTESLQCAASQSEGTM